MKKANLLILLVLIYSALTTVAYSAGVGVYSAGWRVGQLTKFSVKGLLISSGEGQMLMGNESTPYTTKIGEVTKVINPWYFSASDKSIHSALEAVLGDYVVIGYNQARIKGPSVDTEYDVTSVSPLSKKLDELCVADKFIKGMKSSGSRVGRIVKASNKGTIGKSWEIMFQQGNTGNQFKSMSISDDEKLYECAVNYLKAGQKVKITYSESVLNMDVFGRDTNYDLMKIEPVSSGME